ncbi:hypothetical protein ACHHYP_20252, partial [Achlya hypogyna]
LRKSWKIGVELKAVAWGECDILLPKTNADTHNDGIDVALCLTQDLNGTKRTVIGYSAFASVKTLVALWDRGLYFMGHLKTAQDGSQRLLEGRPRAVKRR